jgi:dipeptidyl aminopeptidase/acylaminoacyl peptidase
VFFANFDDQLVYRQTSGHAPEPISTPGCFYADFCVDSPRARILCVREDHTAGDHEPVNTIVSLPLSHGAGRTGQAGRAGAGQTPEVLIAEGADFYSDPIVRADGTVAWIQWNHPNMPWDGTELWRDGRKIAGGTNESIFQPEWSPGGRLYYVSDISGFWNLYCEGEPVHAMAADFGKPQWTFSARTYAFIDASRIAASYTEDGRWKLAVVDTRTRSFEPLAIPLEATDLMCADAHHVYFIGGSPAESRAVVRIALADRAIEVLRPATADASPTAWISVPAPVTFDSNGRDVHAFYYAPHNPDFTAPAGERPPLIVLSHGGPTDQSTDVLDLRLQFWTSRGFAILDVNYSGSSGFGRDYRARLNGTWGIVDVEDCVNGAKALVAQGKADPNRLIIRGGSAGGYTTLAALTFHKTFQAGASYYGISDIEVLARDTHKFESRYLDSLVGPYPAARDVYVQRSPIHFTDRLACALILFQGLEDKVVPPNQSEMMAEAVRRKGLPVAYVAFPGEQHGFRRAENIVRCLEAELYFYGAVFGFEIADAVEPVPIDNLGR